MPYICAYASFHVDSAARVDQVINVEGAGPEAEFQEPEGQYEAADPEQEQEADFTDSFSQQGKPRFIWKPNVTTISLSLTITTMFMH